MLDALPDAKHEDIFWTIRQLVKRCDLLVKNNIMNKNTLHNQLMYSYPSYRKFFVEIDGKSALCFWENYPSPTYIQNTTPEKVYETLKAVYQGLKMERIIEIIALIESDGDTRKDYQEERDFIVKSLVKSIKNNLDQIKEVDIELERILPQAGYKLRTMPGIDLVTEAHLIS